MKLKLWKWEIELKRESAEEAAARGAKEMGEFGFWSCLACGETGEFDKCEVPPHDSKLWPSGVYDWAVFPEMRCACRRAYERGRGIRVKK